MPLEHDAVVTQDTPAEVAISFVSSWWGRFKSAPTRVAIAMLLAQWALETGHGKAMWCHNIGNIKSRDGDGYDYCFFACNELLTVATANRMLAAAKPRTDGVAGLDVRITRQGTATTPSTVWFYPSHAACRFRAYNTLDEGAADYLGLLFTRFQRAWAFILAGDPDGYARALKTLGYYTAEVEHYAKGIRSLFAKYLKEIASLPLEEPSAPPSPSWYQITEEDRARVVNLNASSLRVLTDRLIAESFHEPAERAVDTDDEPEPNA